ncbi:hypothetical protein CVT24_011103 [Panaeolus cyanescens]|uniref:Glycosyltransferase family 18 catalytic domain-containing protein n=1 Tax=Panaeolus cyanescens TaxID=181874 RepID=A0A409YG40_9AGAR|nr:hypothetical protein CVT24_011103 [Panaeolus cyanescens]
MTTYWIRNAAPLRFVFIAFLFTFAYTYLLLINKQVTIFNSRLVAPYKSLLGIKTPAQHSWHANQLGCPVIDDSEVSESDVVVYRTPPAHIDDRFPPPDPQRKDYREWNARTLRELTSCLALKNCGPNQEKIAILSAHWIEEGVVRGGFGGESIWGVSVYNNLRALGYTSFFALEWDEVIAYYRLFPDMVKVCPPRFTSVATLVNLYLHGQVILRDQIGECHLNPQCVKGPDNPSGIPAWKLFDFEYFPHPNGDFKNAGMLKGKWILSACKDVENHENPDYIQYIGYSIENSCRETPYIPLAERPNRAYILMKELVYLYLENFVWEVDYFERAVRDVGIDFVGYWKLTPNWKWEHVAPEKILDIADEEHGIRNIGPLDQKSFSMEVGKSRMMVGIGLPWWSPSPLVGLCQGVPFLNPIHEWDVEDPWNRARWKTQHPELNVYDPPYVYHVHAKNYTGFANALYRASVTEIPRFIPEDMTEQAVQKRLATLMETDWKARAAVLLAENIKKQEAGENVYVRLFFLIQYLYILNH